jgi:L-ascorbate metabolism protein UlaG (beta-lactamase superfamily)
MQVEWHGQSAFSLLGVGKRVFIDPFDDVSAITGRGLQWEYPAIDAGDVDLLLVTHEHLDHNGVEAVGDAEVTLRGTAGRHASPLGEVVGVASEHDAAAGTERGPNTIFVFELDGLRVAHFGDFGQAALRPEQREAMGEVDLAFLPVGGGPTIGAGAAAEIARALDPAWVVPMHYRTPRIGFLETEEEFVEEMGEAVRLDSPGFETGELDRAEGPLVIVPAAPSALSDREPEPRR